MCKNVLADRIETHSHLDTSNIRLLDCTNTAEILLEKAVELGLKGIAITDHETVSSHVKVMQLRDKMKIPDEKTGIAKMPEDFKVIFGNEIYLVNSLEEVRDNYVGGGKTKFPHFILLAKNLKGHEALRKLSSQAWINSFYTGTMERVPTEKTFMYDILSQPEYKGTVMGTSACFLEGTKVNVDGQLVNIEDVENGSLVTTHRQNKYPVNFKTSRQYAGNIHTITTKGSTFPIKSTADHKFLAIPSFKFMESSVDNMTINEKVLNYMQQFKTNSRGSYKLKKYSQNIEPQWIEAKDLNVKQYDILKPIEESVIDIETLDVQKHKKENAKYHIPSFIHVDEDLLWLLGIYTAEGSMDKTNKGRVNFKIDSEKTHIINKIVKIVKTKFNLEASIYPRQDAQAVDINVSSIELHSLFEEWFKHGAINKAVPEFIKQLPKEKQIHFIKGFFLGDGYYRIRDNKNYNISCSTISKQLAYDLSNIFARLGINILINQNPARVDKNGVNHQQWYSLEMNSTIAKKFIDFIYEDKELLIDAIDYAEKDIPYFWNGKKYFRNRVVKNTAQEYNGTVYCLNVDKDHSFEAEGCLVHNCLGSESSIHILGKYFAELENDMQTATRHERKLHEFIQWNIDLFGKDDFYLELQPSPDLEQSLVNNRLIELSKEYGLKMIIANDVHYLRPEDREIHSAYLNSKQDERETDSFYAHTYLHTIEETFEKMSYIDRSIIEEAFENSLEIGNKCENYTLEAPTQIPISRLPEFELQHIFANGYEKYKYIKAFAHSDSDQDRYWLHCIEQGFLEKIPYATLTKERFHEYIDRIDSEVGQLWEMSVKLNKDIADKSKHQHMSSYYVTTLKIVELIWGDDCGDNSLKEGSLLGAGRGSAVAFLTNYLTGITQVNPMEYGLEIPYWRHLNHEMGNISSLDIDLDVTSTKKKYVFRRMREFYGDDNVIQVCTFGKEKPKSAINTACRGLGIPLEDGQYIGSFIPFERGEHWTISDCLYGNEEEGREPVKEFIREIEKFPKLKETALKIEGLINKRSTHAGGVMVYNNGYIESNALMRSPNGDFVTQFNLDDSQATGGIKFDILTIEGNDKLQTVMELLLEYKVIEWKGTLRKTFEFYFHPEKIDKTSSEMYELIGQDRVPDLFQFSTSLAQSVVKKSKPSNLIELAAINSIMRLMSTEGEQPIDTFVRFKNDISLWYKEMEDFGLNERQIQTFESHLLHLNGVADTQESIMLMAMDKRISGFDLKQATDLRKAVSKKKKEAALKIKEVLFKQCEELGNDIVMAEYLWHQIERMLSYAFSIPHTLAYTLIGLIEANIFHKYNPIYWQTACLTVNSGSQELDEDDKKKDKNYGKVAEAIGKLKNYGVNIALPDINYAGISFTPDADNNRIVYSLKGVSGLNDDVAKIIIQNRPYDSFEDFYERVYKNALIGHDQDGNEVRGSLIQKKHMLSLIKAGAFNNFDNPIEIMKLFIFNEIDKKTTLNMQNIKSIIRLGLLNKKEYRHFLDVIQLRDNIKKGKLPKPLNENAIVTYGLATTDIVYKISSKLYEQYQRFFPENDGLIEYSPSGVLISDKRFDKEYKKYIEPLKELIATPEFVREFNIAQFYEMWDNVAQGTVEKWEMESVTYYSDKHELDGVNREMYNISNYFDIDPTPEVIETYEYRGREQQKFKIFTLIGTVLDRNKDKHTFTLLTPEGVVTCKTYAGAFSHYDKAISRTLPSGKKENVEKSWFTRGNLLMVKGFRREDQFVLRTNNQKGMEKEHTINLITGINNDGSLLLKAERERV